MVDRYIRLQLNTLDLKIDRIKERYPRLREERPERERSAYGTLAIYGRIYRRPELWNFTCLLDKNEKRVLQIIDEEHDRLTQKILITDTTDPIWELPPRTRAVAPAPDSDVIVRESAYIEYFAQFYGWLKSIAFGQENSSGLYAVSLTIEEDGARVPPV